MMWESLVWMLIGHAVADYPLQGDWLSKAKNPSLQLVPGETIWPLALLSHAAIHAGAVQLITGSWLISLLEFVAHAAIDYHKCRGWFGYNLDQSLHIACKFMWLGLFMIGVR